MELKFVMSELQSQSSSCEKTDYSTADEDVVAALVGKKLSVVGVREDIDEVGPYTQYFVEADGLYGIIGVRVWKKMGACLQYEVSHIVD